ncbi:MAG: GWxTD domain-containing protein [Candidatus Eisenbacteria bacterium]|uniref:GWxTD domain-containing protein n=1 Tax=Eiseniibacteriota bacterium TaxID=2212470 RepID=A0A849SIE6_UNCEI|nr:GWxTD domain-containing protein [Candidatus Eisenbacteria bacterium]
MNRSATNTTRSLLRGARWFCALVALTMLIGARPRAVPEDDLDGPGPLPWRVPGRMTFTVDAAAFPDSGATRLEVYLRVPNSTLAGLGRERDGRGRLVVLVNLVNAFGARAGEVRQSLEFAPGDSGGALGKVLMLPFRTRPGAHRLEVRLEDPEPPRVGLIGRRARGNEQVRGDFVVPGPQAGREISDLEFAWAEGLAPSERGFAHGQRQLLPNPERLYGLLQTELIAAFEARGRAESNGAWHWISRVLDSGGRIVSESDSSGPTGPRLAVIVRHDLASVPAGAYALEVRAWQEGDSGSLARRAPFSVGWQENSWSRGPADAVDEVHLLFDQEEEERFERMSVGAREAYLEEWWRRRDPSPETAENEARVTFRQRADFANKTWSRSALEPGMFSDMGRVFIRYGEPDAVERQVIPTGDETLNRIVRELNLTDARPTGDIAMQGLGGNQHPFELWIYQGESRLPLNVPRDQPGGSRFRRRLVFLFVDEHGYGDFRQRYSTE